MHTASIRFPMTVTRNQFLYQSMAKKISLRRRPSRLFRRKKSKKFKTEAFSVFDSSKRKYQQAVAYILMLDTRLRTGEALVLLNSDIDIKFFTPKPLAELFDYTTSEITELYYVKRDLKMLNVVTDGFEL